MPRFNRENGKLGHYLRVSLVAEQRAWVYNHSVLEAEKGSSILLGLPKVIS